MDAVQFEHYTERLRASLESVPGVVGLVTLGSTADPTFRDQWSDHDFWVITEPGAQDSLIQDLSWLPDYQDILFEISHSNGRTLLFRNRHKVEFIVFDPGEMSSGKVERYRVLIDRDRIAELMRSVHEQTLRQAKLRPQALENLCVLAWSACERHARGERLAARQYVDGFAINQLLNLILEGELPDERRDALDQRRRLELRAPELAAELLDLSGKPVPQAALRLLEIAERELKPREPALAWDKVAMVRDWISEIRSSRAQL